MKERILLTVLILSLLGNIVTIFYLAKLTHAKQSKVDTPSSTFKYLSPRIQNSNRNEIYLNFTPLRQILKTYIKAQSNPIHMYFEYLPSGISIGINDEIESPTASLIKVPTVMAILNKIDKKQLSLNQLLLVTEKHLDKTYGTFWQKGVGATISVEDSILKTIAESDNTTHNLLYNILSPEERKGIFEELDIEYVTSDLGDLYYINPKSYTSILKSLYFSTYLSYESSDKLLQIMTKSIDKSKLAAGIEPNIDIAHKIGVNERTEGKFIYNDCGIIYYPKRPYAICVMVEGTENQATENIQTISKFVFDYMKSL